MTFVLYEEDPLYYYTVNLEQPSEEGTIESVPFQAGYRNLDQPRIMEIMRQIVAVQEHAKSGNVPEDGISDDKIADEVLGGWRDLVTPDGQDVPFTVENKARLLRKRGVASKIAAGWLESLTLQQEEREGN